MKIINNVNIAPMGTGLCRTCGRHTKKGLPRIQFDDDSFACYKCFEKVIDFHKKYLTEYLNNAIPKFKKEMGRLKKGCSKELIIESLKDGD